MPSGISLKLSVCSVSSKTIRAFCGSVAFIAICRLQRSFSSRSDISSIILPLSIKINSDAVWYSSSKIWLDTNIVIPYSLFKDFSKLRISTIPAGSSPLIGSSKIRNSGVFNSAIAIPNRCRIPSEKLRTAFFPVSFRPTMSKVFWITALSGIPRWIRCISIFW